MDLNGREAAVFGGMLCSSNEADDAELTGDQINDEAGGQTDEQLDGGHGKDVAGGPDNIGEARRLTISNDPGRPTRREVEEHMPFQWPYRSWCKRCVRSGSAASFHRRKTAEEREFCKDRIPTMSLDPCFM